MPDEITLTLPAEEDFRRVAHLVIGGLAVRLDLTWETLEDLQLALDGVLERRDEEGEVTVSVRVDAGELHTLVGPFSEDALRELEHDDGGLGLRRILETTCDRIDLSDRGGARWVELTKRVARTA
jgi:anti-sigma regulatory factor (Ser/Thr protein kinase)